MHAIMWVLVCHANCAPVRLEICWLYMNDSDMLTNSFGELEIYEMVKELCMFEEKLFRVFVCWICHKCFVWAGYIKEEGNTQGDAEAEEEVWLLDMLAVASKT